LNNLSSNLKEQIMKIKFLFPILGVIGIIWAIIYVKSATPPPPVAEPVMQPSIISYKNYIGGAGLTEPNSENINIGTHVTGVVKNINVQVGDAIKKGDILFTIENSEATADVAVAEANLTQAEADLNNQKDQFDIITNIKDSRAVSQDERNKSLRNLESARAKFESAKATLDAAKTRLDLHSVKSPIDGVVMTMNLRVGEFAQSSNNGDPLMRVGNLTPLHIRVDIDENDAWRFKAGANAKAFVRGNTEISVPLSFVRTEPYVRPKKSLTGESAERVDTRVLQIIYSFDPTGLPIFAGQQMDVYIEVAE
jgi:RND family efflux transporter MFP subunit